uniref:CCDC174 alpha/beta GRSR domain-containing protein n=1 Tax=Ciona savignyi TaxID=51511 RepID=H2ZBP0_CIOSA
MLNLKAELVKKQKELNNQKSTNGSYISTANKGPPKVLPWKKNKGVEARNNRDVEHQDEDVDKMKKVHAILEAKSKMYDKLTSGNLIPDKDDTQMFMVDFEQKSIDAWRSKKEKGEMSSKPETKVKVLDDVRKVIDEAKEEWVEYVDSLGRTRTCRKSDIHLLENIDKKLDGKVEPRQGASGKTLMSDDMRREEEREQWEQEERSKMEEEEGPIFYQNIRDGEIRELGVGYYGFSGDKKERDEQMKRLNKMRDDTQLNRKKMVQKKEEQRLALQTRLEKIRQRRVKKLL